MSYEVALSDSGKVNPIYGVPMSVPTTRLCVGHRMKGLDGAFAGRIVAWLEHQWVGDGRVFCSPPTMR